MTKIKNDFFEKYMGLMSEIFIKHKIKWQRKLQVKNTEFCYYDVKSSLLTSYTW